jgi:hypothetical protein
MTPEVRLIGVMAIGRWAERFQSIDYSSLMKETSWAKLSLLASDTGGNWPMLLLD